jgi:hypothetical protein
MMVIDNKFELGDIVYLKTDPDQRARIVSKFSVLPNGLIVYELSHNTFTSPHYDFEISVEKDVLITTTN